MAPIIEVHQLNDMVSIASALRIQARTSTFMKFMDLPLELRLDIYQYILVSDEPISFGNRSAFLHLPMKSLAITNPCSVIFLFFFFSQGYVMIGYALPDSHTNALQHHEAAHHAVDSLFLFSLWERHNQLGILGTKAFQQYEFAVGSGFCFAFGNIMISCSSCARKAFSHDVARFAEKFFFFCFFFLSDIMVSWVFAQESTRAYQYFSAPNTEECFTQWILFFGFLFLFWEVS
jgi:hypothetical protein